MSRYKMIAREDIEAHCQGIAKDLEKQRVRMYAALDVLPAKTDKDFQARDALNHEISATNGEHRALRALCIWLAEHYPKADDQLATLQAAEAAYEEATAHA